MIELKKQKLLMIAILIQSKIINLSLECLLAHLVELGMLKPGASLI